VPNLKVFRIMRPEGQFVLGAWLHDFCSSAMSGSRKHLHSSCSPRIVCQFQRLRDTNIGDCQCCAWTDLKGSSSMA